LPVSSLVNAQLLLVCGVFALGLLVVLLLLMSLLAIVLLLVDASFVSLSDALQSVVASFEIKRIREQCSGEIGE
jgi:hypothetical protein